VSSSLKTIIRQPKDDTAKVWRFMDLPKFLDFLDRGALYFGRLDKLEDPYEGLPSEEEFDALRKDPGLSWMADLLHGSNKYNIFVNSWHIAEHEPAAMWKLYAGVDAGIALCSTYKRLVAATARSAHKVRVGLVHYGTPPSRGVETWELAMCKRKSFEHEREVRAIIPPAGLTFSSKQTSAGPRASVSQHKKHGIHVPVRMNDLVTEVVLSPTAPAWVTQTVSHVAIKFGLKAPVRKSTLYELDFAES